MSKLKIFISSHQKEFKKERKEIKNFIENTKPYSDLFDAFLFEDVPSIGKNPKKIFSKEVLNSDIFIGLIGENYGEILENGLSATEYEFELFKENKDISKAFMFILENLEGDNNTKKFINKARKITYNRFNKTNVIKKVQNSLDAFISRTVHEKSLPFDKRFEHEITLSDIDIEQVKYFIKKSNLNDDISNDKKLENFLINKVKVLRKSENNLKICNTGILFFCKKPQYFISQHEVKIARFQTRDKIHIIDSVELKYPMLKLLDEIKKFINKQLKVAQKIDGFRRIDIPEYPYDALREAIINAIVHRNYDFVGTSVSIFIFSDRIEITSPGRSLVEITVIEETFAHRNTKICDLFQRTHDMEKFGTGIKKMNEIMSKNKMKNPLFKNLDEFFRTTFYGRSEEELMKIMVDKSNSINLKDLGLKDRQISALTLMVNNKISFSLKEYEKYFNVSRYTASRDLNDLFEKGLIFKNNSKNDKKVLIFNIDEKIK
jgi:predicted HTH transcriptional regulator